MHKSARTMTLKMNGRPVKTYLIALGKNAGADKMTRGDKATPAGDYYVCEKNPRSRFYLALKLSYPNAQDAQTALARGVIDTGTCARIENAVHAGKEPPMDTALGGNICIHGGGAGRVVSDGGTSYAEIRDWTAGCIALGKNEIEELYAFVPLGARVHITS